MRRRSTRRRRRRTRRRRRRTRRMRRRRRRTWRTRRRRRRTWRSIRRKRRKRNTCTLSKSVQHCCKIFRLETKITMAHIRIVCAFINRKGHSHSPQPQKKVHNFSLEGPTIFFFYLHHFHTIILPVLFVSVK